MILEESPALEAGPAFFEVFAQLVRESGLLQSEITRRINVNSRRHALYVGKSKKAAFHQSTLGNIVKGRDLPSEMTLYRIARLGLGLSEEQCLWLELLRLEEEPINHSTTQPQITIPSKVQMSQTVPIQDEEEIEWIREKENAGICRQVDNC